MKTGVAALTDAGMTAAKENGLTYSFKLESGEEVAIWNTPWIVSDGGCMTTYTDSEGNPRPL